MRPVQGTCPFTAPTYSTVPEDTRLQKTVHVLKANSDGANAAVLGGEGQSVGSEWVLHVSAIPSHIEVSDGTVSTRKNAKATRSSLHVRATRTGYYAASAWLKISLHQHTALA